MRATAKAMNTALILGAFTLIGPRPALASKDRTMNHKITAGVTMLMVGAGGMEVVTGATGGEAITADKTGAAWTTLAGPVISETYAKDTGGPGLGTIVLNVPAGFEFNPNATVTVMLTAGGNKTVDGVADGETMPTIVTPTSITLNITAVSHGGVAYPDTLTFQNIQVRPTSGTVLASGDITQSGTCQFRDLTLSSGTWGHLQEVGGVLPQVVLADPLGDPDGDGRSNLMEYALGTDPTNPSDTQTGMKVWIMEDSGNKYLALGFKQRVTAGLPLQYVPEVSGDKQSWFSDSAHVVAMSTTSVDAQFNWVVVRDSQTITPATPRFVRLTVIQN